MKKGNKLWLPVVIVLGVLIVGLFAGSIIVKNTIGKHEAKKGSGEVVVIEKNDTSTKEKAKIKGENFSYTATIEVEVLSKLENPDVYIIDDNPRYYEYTDSTFKNLTAEELYYATYEIYARSNVSFDDPTIQAYFDSKSWYYKSTNKTMTSFEEKLATSTSDYDKQVENNIKAIKKYIEDNNLQYTPN